jgi:TetR/AcrR family transcriptional repressor of nem operon
MPRPRAFDEADVLDAAVDCFWRRGLEATSIRDLAAEMGINCPSLYNAFGDKRALFLRVLEHYVCRFTRERIRRLEEMASPKAAIRAYFDDLVSCSLDDLERRGCLIINAAIEIAPGDEELRAVLAGYFREIEGFFRRRLEAAQALGEIPASLSPAGTARLLFAVMLGVRVAARTRPERDLLEGMAGPALALLDFPA